MIFTGCGNLEPVDTFEHDRIEYGLYRLECDGGAIRIYDLDAKRVFTVRQYRQFQKAQDAYNALHYHPTRSAPDNMPTKVPDDTPEQLAAGPRADVDSCSLEELEATADFYDRLVRGETPCSTITEKNESGGAA